MLALKQLGLGSHGPTYIAVAIAVIAMIVGYALGCSGVTEAFIDITQTTCSSCSRPRRECGCERKEKDCSKDANGKCIKCPQVDWSKYVLKASIPPCPAQPDMSRYMLKSECPAPPDMSRYILKSAVPSCPPCISTCNKPCKIGDCPPCPRPRCPVVTCPEPKACAPCAPVEPPRCPEPSVSCKANYEPDDPWLVRPLLASISGR